MLRHVLSRVSDIPDYSRRASAAFESGGRYLTDGTRLFRVVTPFAINETDAHVFMSLEECLTLEVQSYSPQQLYGMRLRPVVLPGDA
jgi:hypothetical protein